MHTVVGADEVSTTLHTIRLAGPWEFQVAGGAIEWRTIKLPMTWQEIVQSFDRDQPQTKLLARRRFQRPTGLDGGVRVWMVMGQFTNLDFKLRINDVAMLSADGDGVSTTAFDITDSLQASNLLTVEFDIDRLIPDDAIESTFVGALIEIRNADDASG